MYRLHDVVNKFVLELGVTYSKHTLQDCYYNQISRCPPYKLSAPPHQSLTNRWKKYCIGVYLKNRQFCLSREFCVFHIYTSDLQQRNISIIYPPKNLVVQMLKNFFLHCSTFTKCFYSNKYYRFTYMLHVRFQVFSHSCM